MGVQVPELKQCVTTLVRLFFSSTPFVGSCFVSSLLVSLFLLLFREKFSRILSLSAAPSIVVLCVVSRRARAHRQKKKKDADNTPLVVSLFKSTDTWIKN